MRMIANGLSTEKSSLSLPDLITSMSRLSEPGALSADRCLSGWPNPDLACTSFHHLSVRGLSDTCR
jgi:hypothetical protein